MIIRVRSYESSWERDLCTRGEVVCDGERKQVSSETGGQEMRTDWLKTSLLTLRECTPGEAEKTRIPGDPEDPWRSGEWVPHDQPEWMVQLSRRRLGLTESSGTPSQLPPPCRTLSGHLPLQEGRGKSHVALFSEPAWQVSTAWPSRKKPGLQL